MKPARPRAAGWQGFCGPALVACLAMAALTLLPSVPALALTAPASHPTAPTAAAPATTGPAVRVRGGELVDLSTGAKLWGESVDVRRPMGSITKVMTALLVMRIGHLSREIRITRTAVRYVHKDGASSAGLRAGDVLTARQLLSAMLVPSGCDAAFMLATAYGPGRKAFIGKMNKLAKTLGLTGTHFTSFDGMPYPTEYSTYSTPSDLIKLGEQAMRYKVFREIVARQRFGLKATALHHAYSWVNTNKLIGSYRGAVGIKTGDTDKAGNCLLFEARRGTLSLIGVVLHASPSSNPLSAIDAARVVLNWGFRRR